MSTSKTVLITGASTGIGRASVIYFQERGWNVIATMRKPENETELTQLDNVLVTRLDVLDLDSIQAAVNAGIERFGKIDVLVNNAGYGACGPLEAFPRENMIRQFNTNVIGLLDVSRAVIPHLRKQKSGVIINISSIGGQMTFPFFSLYHGTKFAVEGISDSLAWELGEFGVKVKLVEPGRIETDFGTRSLDLQNDPGLEEYQPLVQKFMEVMTNGGREGTPASGVAEVIFTAATDGTDTLRYRAGDDAHALLDARKQLDDASFRAAMIQNLGF